MTQSANTNGDAIVIYVCPECGGRRWWGGRCLHHPHPAIPAPVMVERTYVAVRGQ